MTQYVEVQATINLPNLAAGQLATVDADDPYVRDALAASYLVRTGRRLAGGRPIPPQVVSAPPPPEPQPEEPEAPHEPEVAPERVVEVVAGEASAGDGGSVGS